MTRRLKSLVKAQARRDAAEAVLYGATAPWGDGETIPDVRDLLNTLKVDVGGRERADRKEIAGVYDLAFRAAIDDLAPEVTP